ncbi:MAG: SIMPL domain-containing protein [Gemmatimonadaceae bacterium]|nr:SIMPL domain-containing protein [Gemmatimonadaceae bacterium]
MDDRKSQHLYGLAALALGLVIGLIAVSSSLKDIRRGNEEVAVTGSARRPIRSDFVVWRLTVAVQSPSLATASQELSRHAVRVRQFLTSERIGDSLVTARPVEAAGVPELTDDGRETGRILTNRASQSFEVRSPDVDGITRSSQRISSLIAEGIPVQAQAPEYVYTRLSDIRTQLLEEATRDARARAEAIVRSTGGQIGAVREARMGVFQITPRFSTEIADYGINDVTSIDKDVTAVVRVTFTIR